MLVRVALSLALLLMTGCAGGRSDPPDSQAGIPAGVRSMVDLGDGRQIEMFCAGSGSPTVVLVHGHMANAASFAPIIPAIAETTRVCAYNRLGVGGSSAPPGVRSATAMARDLQGLVDEGAIKRPLVLVGHSMAGFIVPVYADRYGGNVAGLLFLDPAVPATLSTLGSSLGSPRSGEPADVDQRRREFAAGWPGPERNSERHNVKASEKEAAAVTSLGDLPVIVLTAEELLWQVSDPAAQQRMHAAWVDLHRRLAGLSSDGRQETVPDSVHGLQVSNPDVVVSAVGELVARARGDG